MRVFFSIPRYSKNEEHFRPVIRSSIAESTVWGLRDKLQFVL